LYSEALEAALRWAAVCHQGQERRGSGVPYVQHVVAVAMILDRLGYGQEVVIAGLLHDVVEDTEATLDEVSSRFGPVVAAIVAHATEVKLDDRGVKRPWIDRKRDHLAAMASAPAEARAVLLADKLHNLVSIARDLRDGRPIWGRFNAPRSDVLWYHQTAINLLSEGAREDPRLARLADECRLAWNEVEGLGPGEPG
jgi:(p)ppGpp synthase/HD superfamily hydrolase